MAYQIMTDSAWDMGAEKAEELNVEVIAFYVAKDGEVYQKEAEELPVRELYQYMVDHPGVFPKTSQPSLEEYITRFENHAKRGEDIIFCTANKAFTGAYNAACLAKQMTQEKYPDCRISIVDTTQVTLMQGLIVQELALAQKTGIVFEEAVRIVEHIKATARIFFTVSGMDYLIHGGRVGKIAGTAANVLNICPMLCLSNGDLISTGLARGRKAARNRILQNLIGYVKDNGNDPARFTYIVGYGYDISEGDIMQHMLLDALKKEWPDFTTNIESGQIGAAIGVHTGPHPIGFGVVERWDYQRA